MRKTIAAALAVLLALLIAAGAACAEQKAPDFILEGLDTSSAGHVWETNLFFVRMQDKTGISFQFSQVTTEEAWASRKMGLMEKENLPDALFKAELSAAEVRELYEAGVLIDLRPYLEQYAPDLWALLEEHPDWRRAIEMPDGAIPALPNFNTLQSNDAMWINTDWLTMVGMEAPTTAEELTAVLRAFKTKDPNRNGRQDEVPLSFIGMWELRFLGHAFGIVDNDYYLRVKDGKVTSSLTTAENRAFLAWLHQLWEEGLLDHNGFSMTDSMRQVTDEKRALRYGMFLSYSPLTVVPSAHMSRYRILMPLSYQGEQVYRDWLGDVVRGTFAVTTACREPEKLVSWVNFLYTEEGMRLALYGEEKTDWFWNEDGWWEWNAGIEEVAGRILPEDTLSDGGILPGLTPQAFPLKYADAQVREQMEQMTALKAFSVLPFPAVNMTREDEERTAELHGNIMGYAERAMACFVTGDTELNDENWAIFCATVEEKGLGEMIAIWQKYVPGGNEP